MKLALAMGQREKGFRNDDTDGGVPDFKNWSFIGPGQTKRINAS